MKPRVAVKMHLRNVGNTAVYLLYAHARICSIIRKSDRDIEELENEYYTMKVLMILNQIAMQQVLLHLCLVILDLLNKKDNCSDRWVFVTSSKVLSGASEILSLLRALGEGYRLSCMFRCQDARDVYLKLPPKHYNTGWVLSQKLIVPSLSQVGHLHTSLEELDTVLQFFII